MPSLCIYMYMDIAFTAMKNHYRYPDLKHKSQIDLESQTSTN